MHLSTIARLVSPCSCCWLPLLVAQEQVHAVSPSHFSFEQQPISLAGRGCRRLSLRLGPRAAPRRRHRAFCTQTHNSGKLSTISKPSWKPPGLTLDNVVYVQVYLTDIGSYSEMNRVFGEYFPKTAASSSRPRSLCPCRSAGSNQRSCGAQSGGAEGGLSCQIFLKTSPHRRAFLLMIVFSFPGMAGIDPATGKVPDDPAAQVDLALDRMQAVVKAAGLEMSHVVFVNPYLTSDIPSRVMNERYARRFEFGNTPAAPLFEVSSLPGGAHIEYTGVAVRDLQQRKAVRPKNMPPSPTASPCVFAGDTLYCSAKSGFIPGPHGGVYATTTQHQAPADDAQSSRQPRRGWNGFQSGCGDECLSGRSHRRAGL